MGIPPLLSDRSNYELRGGQYDQCRSLPNPYRCDVLRRLASQYRVEDLEEEGRGGEVSSREVFSASTLPLVHLLSLVAGKAVSTVEE